MSISANLIDQLKEARSRTLALVEDLSDEQLMGPRLDIVNPLLWEIGHVAWFQEKWTLRHLLKKEPIREDGDRLYDSMAVAHDTRWDLPLPSRKKTLRYMEQVLSGIIEALQSPKTEEEAYFYRLALFHEDMHDEAFTHTRQTLNYFPPPLWAQDREEKAASQEERGPLSGDVEVPGGTFPLGSTPEMPFVFDNEKWSHPVQVKPFRVARAATSNAEFAVFVEEGGYQRREWWSEPGWSWREQADAQHPVYWKRESANQWMRRHFNQFHRLEENLPVIHVNWYETEAYCNWSGRRLLSEPEWEMAASQSFQSDGTISEAKRRFPWGDEPPTSGRANLDWEAGGCVEVGALKEGDSPSGCRQMIGNVWEWIANDFLPYPGFVVDPYKDYSEPWFGTRKVMRGGCWTTRSRLVHNTWRNYQTPDRRDILAGFRTAARDTIK